MFDYLSAIKTTQARLCWISFLCAKINGKSSFVGETAERGHFRSDSSWFATVNRPCQRAIAHYILNTKHSVGEKVGNG